MCIRDRLARLQYWSMLAQKDEDNLLKRLLNASDRERNSAKKKKAAELKKAEKRKAEVDGLFAKMYEDWSAAVSYTHLLASSFCGSVAEDKLHRIPFGYFVIRRNRRKSGIDRRTGNCLLYTSRCV